MATLLISLLTLVLLLISAFVVLIVLMQKTSQNGGMGAALGGGAAESAFGSDTNNVLTKGTIYGTIAFFVVSLALYLLYQAQAAERVQEVNLETLVSDTEVRPTAETTTEVLAEEAALVSDEPVIELNSNSEQIAQSIQGASAEVDITDPKVGLTEVIEEVEEAVRLNLGEDPLTNPDQD